MTGRLVWMDEMGRDVLRYYAARAESSADQMLLYGIAAAYDAAPADSAEAVAAKLNEIDGDPAFRDQPWYVVAPHVLRALGMPDD